MADVRHPGRRREKEEEEGLEEGREEGRSKREKEDGNVSSRSGKL